MPQTLLQQRRRRLLQRRRRRLLQRRRRLLQQRRRRLLQQRRRRLLQQRRHRKKKGKGNDVGVYAVTQGTLTNAGNTNYDITFVQGSLTIEAPTPLSASVTALSGTVSTAPYRASAGAKLKVSASGGGTGLLTWTVATGTCGITDVLSGTPDTTQKQISTSGKNSCSVTISRAADGSYATSSITLNFQWG